MGTQQTVAEAQGQAFAGAVGSQQDGAPARPQIQGEAVDEGHAPRLVADPSHKQGQNVAVLGGLSQRRVWTQRLRVARCSPGNHLRVAC